MLNENIKYKNSQLAKWILALGIISFPLLLLSYFYKWGNHPLALSTLGLTFLVLLIILLLFYKLTIIIDDEKILAVFGIGLIKKSISLNKIDLSSIEEIKIPWYYGIGIRVTPYGVLYNVKPGKAIRLKSKIENKIFLVGTNDFEEIQKILLQKS
jgi:hypothetical protein